MYKKDLTNRKFGRLTAIKSIPSDTKNRLKWLCECDCGEYIKVVTANLTSGHTKSCGCLGSGVTREDLVGERFGALTIVKYKGQDKDRQSLYEYLCDCGNTGQIRKSTFGKTFSCPQCGFDRRDNSFEEIGGWYWTSIRSSAKERNYEFNVSIQYLWDIYLKQNRKCFYTQKSIIFTNKQNRKNQTASLDRTINNIGYIEGNVQWVHRDINVFKRDISAPQFIDLCKEIIANEQFHSQSRNSANSIGALS